jgi:hypothetical protein
LEGVFDLHLEDMAVTRYLKATSTTKAEIYFSVPGLSAREKWNSLSEVIESCTWYTPFLSNPLNTP